jgi:ADP-ribose pyrophosphatase
VINVDIDTVQFPNGSTGELEMVRHPGASAVVPFLTDPLGEDPQILLIKQFRHAADAFIYEVPAGKLEGGEPPIECARRELREETGCTAGKMDHIYTLYTTPGFTDEKIHVVMGSSRTRKRLWRCCSSPGFAWAADRPATLLTKAVSQFGLFARLIM